MPKKNDPLAQALAGEPEGKMTMTDALKVMEGPKPPAGAKLAPEPVKIEDDGPPIDPYTGTLVKPKGKTAEIATPISPLQRQLAELEAKFMATFSDNVNEQGRLGYREALEKEIREVKERIKLTEGIVEKGIPMDIQARAKTETPRQSYQPDDAVMRRVWEMAYNSALHSIFSKGLAFWNSKGKVLASEMELAAIRADEALEAFIRVRKVSPDPLVKELQDWQKNKSTNELAKD